MTDFAFTRFHAVVVGCGLALASCWTMPNSSSNAPTEVAFELPKTLGTWERIQESSLEENELRILRASDHWRHCYQCRETKRVVIITLIAGPTGPLASHQPEVCYCRHEYGAYSEATVWSVPARRDKFRFQTLEPRQIERPALTIAYAWCGGRDWVAPRFPRIELAGRSGLNRLQITMRHPGGGTQESRLAIQQFVRLALDVVEGRSS